jgi:hypothetical protein
MKCYNVMYGMKLRIILTLLIFALAACGSVFPSISTATPSPEPSPMFTPSPGLMVLGRVTLNDVGLEGVKIYRRFSAYPPELIAVTDKNGNYESAFIPIPGDEMVSIEAELAGYNFDPPYYYWRHYHGYEETKCDFVAVSMP